MIPQPGIRWMKAKALREQAQSAMEFYAMAKEFALDLPKNESLPRKAAEASVSRAQLEAYEALLRWNTACLELERNPDPKRNDDLFGVEE